MAAFGFIGVFFFILARDPGKYPAMVNLGGGGLIIFGVFCFGWGFYYNFETWMWVADGSFCLITGALILFIKSPKEFMDTLKETMEYSGL